MTRRSFFKAAPAQTGPGGIETPGEQTFVLASSLLGAAGGESWLAAIVLILLTPAGSALDLGVGVVALALLCLLESSLEAWGRANEGRGCSSPPPPSLAPRAPRCCDGFSRDTRPRRCVRNPI